MSIGMKPESLAITLQPKLFENSETFFRLASLLACGLGPNPPSESPLESQHNFRIQTTKHRRDRNFILG